VHLIVYTSSDSFSFVSSSIIDSSSSNSFDPLYVLQFLL
jgi:hypothetical protein